MSTFWIGSDRINGKEQSYIKTIANKLSSAGHSVKNLGVGPNVVQRAGSSANAKGCIGVLIAGGSDAGMYYDFVAGLKQGYYHYSEMWVVFASWAGSDWISCKGLQTKKLVRAHDDNYSSASGLSHVVGKTASQYFSENSQYIKYACGSNASALADTILSGTSTSGTSTNNTYEGGPDYGVQTDGGAAAPLLSGEKTFQDLIGEMCNGIDVLFLCKRNQLVITDFETIYAEAQWLRQKHRNATRNEDLHLWQLEDGSYEVNVDDFGFYNVVYVKYANGVVREAYDDLVTVYGEQPITYTEKNLSKTQAIQKAKTYLAAHVREFNLSLNVDMIDMGGIDIGDVVTLEKPHNLKNDSEFYFVKGLNREWDDGPITLSLELGYAPENPDRPEVPTTGTYGYYSNSDSGSDSGSGEIGGSCWQKYWDIASTFVYGGWGSGHSPIKAWEHMGEKTGSSADCWDCTAWLYYVLNFKCKIPTRDCYTPGHHCVQVKQNGKWVYPDEYDRLTMRLRRNSTMRAGGGSVYREAPSNLNDPSTIPSPIGNG